MSWAYFSERPGARVHYFKDTPWVALSATTACGVRVFINRLSRYKFPSVPHIISGKEKHRCLRCLNSIYRSKR